MAGLSEVTLNGIHLDIDPDNYEMFGGKRRGAALRTLDGGTVYQDRGFNETDGLIQMTGKFTDETTLVNLLKLYKIVGTAFTFVDFKGNQYQVVFTPGQDSCIVSPIQGSDRGFLYKISLSIVSVTKRFDAAGEYATS